jgi:hypothetical protein
LPGLAKGQVILPPVIGSAISSLSIHIYFSEVIYLIKKEYWIYIYTILEIPAELISFEQPEQGAPVM